MNRAKNAVTNGNPNIEVQMFVTRVLIFWSIVFLVPGLHRSRGSWPLQEKAVLVSVEVFGCWVVLLEWFLLEVG